MSLGEKNYVNLQNKKDIYADPNDTALTTFLISGMYVKDDAKNVDLSSCSPSKSQSITRELITKIKYRSYIYKKNERL